MVEFELDKQTLKDLGVFVDHAFAKSISNFYNQTKTEGGKNYLYHLMKNPITDINALKERTELIQFLMDVDFDLNINSSQLEFIEHYQKLNTDPLKSNKMNALVQYVSHEISPNNDYYLIKSGVQQLVDLFILLKEKMSLSQRTKAGLKFKKYQERILEIVEHHDFQFLYVNLHKISSVKLNKLDHLFREKYQGQVENIMHLIYRFDAYVSIAKVSKQNKLSIPEYSDLNTQSLILHAFYHPLLNNAIPYTLNMNEDSNLCFLTGPNMAGKSTFLKSVGLSIYLAHIGFPVPAKKMRTSIYHGIVTAINLSDDMHLGYSHFYSEVNRVKETALKIKEKRKLFVIFDELFRGTNVKDAFDSSFLVIKAFSEIKDSTFFVSTHITEVAEELEDIKTIQFKRFSSTFVDNKPTYTYILEDGISHERMGMYILKNEKVIEILDSIVNENKKS